MMEVVNLNTLSPQQQRDIFASIDNILCDNDGVLAAYGKMLPGGSQCIKKFQAAGKRFKIITNNTAMGSKILSDIFRKAGVDCPPEDIITPTMAIIKYLKDTNFQGKIWIIACEAMEEEFKENGFIVTDSEKHKHLGIFDSKEYYLNTDPEVKAIVLDFTLNATVANISKIVNYLKKYPEMLLIFGSLDAIIPLTTKQFVIGASHYHKLIVDITKHTPLDFGKPSDNLGKYLVETIGCDPSRTLFIGDNLDIDIGFGKKMGFKTLLVLTGVSKLEDIDSCGDGFSPDYYLSSIEELNHLLENNRVL